MPVMSTTMKDITHYFRPSGKNDGQPKRFHGDKVYGKSNSFLECNEESKVDVCELYSSDSDGDLVIPKRKSQLIVQVPGISACENSLRKRKRTEEVNPSVHKNKTLCSSPNLEHKKTNGANENVDDSFYMSPLRLDSDSSPEDSPSGKVTPVYYPNMTSPICSRKKSSLRIAKNRYLALAKNKITVDSPQEANSSFSTQCTPVRTKLVMEEKDSSGSLHKYFQNVSAEKSENENCCKDIPGISLAKDNPWTVAFIDPPRDSMEGGEKLTSKTVKPIRSSHKKIPFRHKLSGRKANVNSQQLKSVGQSPTKLNNSSSIRTDNDLKAGTYSKSKNKCFKASPKNVSDNSKSSKNNLLNYFDKAVTLKKFKSLKLKNKRKYKQKIKSVVVKNLRSPFTVSSRRGTVVTKALRQHSNLGLLSASAQRRKTKKNSHTLRKISDNGSVQVNADPSSSDVNGIFKLSQVETKVNSNRKEIRITRRSERISITKSTISSTAKASEGPSNLLTGAVGKSQDEGKPIEKEKVLRTSLRQKLLAIALEKHREKSDVETHLSGRKEIYQRSIAQGSVNQRRAAEIVRRACQQTVVKQRIKDASLPETSDVIILSEKMNGGETKKIVIMPSYVKLAPLFLAKEELQKKKVFLQSGAPEIVVRRMKQQKRMEIELEEASAYPSVSHTQQKDTAFPWCLDTNPELTKLFPLRNIGHLEQERRDSLSSARLCLGYITSLPSFFASILVNLRPPLPSKDSPPSSPHMSPEPDESLHCFCVGLSPDTLTKEDVQEYSTADVEMFERVHAWFMRSLLPPGIAFKMCVDLSSFLPSLSPAGFHYDHILALPSNDSGILLRNQMLLKLKEDYPNFPVNRRFKGFNERIKSDGGLCLFSCLPVPEVITLASPPQRSEDGKCSNKDSPSEHRDNATSKNLRRSRRKRSFEKSTPIPKVKKAVDSTCDTEASSMHSVNETADRASCSSLLTSESWTDIFAPTSYSDACSLGRNLKTLDKLKNWLDSWTRRSSEKGSRRVRNNAWRDSEEEYSSGIEFCSSDDDEAKETKNLPTNVAILFGPCGSGKTSSVYALAKEMNYKVLEINASSKRTGKYILATVKEATRSYQVMSSCGVNSSASIGSFFKKTPQNTKQNESKFSKEQKESQIPKKCTKSSERASSAMSLIFVEDVDVVFENEDEGFIGALTSLTTSTKRPVILEVHTSKPLQMGTTNSWLLEEIVTESCPHLINFLAKQNRTPLILPFERNRSNFNAEALLRVACLSEGVWVSQQWSECILKHTAGDFRRALQEAQFWAGSVARSSVALGNLSRYPKEVMQKSEVSDNHCTGVSSTFMDAPINLCGCVGKRFCSYPYSWMYKNYIQHLWLQLDQVVDISLLSAQDVSPGNISKSNEASTLLEKNPLKETSMIMPQKSVPQEVPQHKTHLLSSCGGIIKIEKPVTPEKANSPLPVKQSPRTNKGNKQLFCHSLKRRVRCKTGSTSGRVGARHKLNFVIEEEEKIKEEVKEDVKEILNSVLKGQNSRIGDRVFPKKTHLTVFSNNLDVLCTSDVLLKKFSDTESFEIGKNLVFEMGNVTNLIHMSMQVSSSKKSREMEAKQVKDACTAAQYQMILPIVPNYWILNCPALALDVAPHIREICRILDELTKTGRTRTRMSCRLPTINRIGPTLREALCRTLVDDIDIKDSSDAVIIAAVKEKNH